MKYMSIIWNSSCTRLLTLQQIKILLCLQNNILPAVHTHAAWCSAVGLFTDIIADDARHSGLLITNLKWIKCALVSMDKFLSWSFPNPFIFSHCLFYYDRKHKSLQFSVPLHKSLLTHDIGKNNWHQSLYDGVPKWSFVINDKASMAGKMFIMFPPISV